MPTESQFTARLLRALRAHPALRDAVIWKHNDRTTRGIPDFSMTINGRTTWWEIKVGDNRLTKIQKYFIERLQPVAFVVRCKCGSLHFLNETAPSMDFGFLVDQIVSRARRDDA